jgi:glycosyltransferase involved in cell wall biosynthesis
MRVLLSAYACRPNTGTEPGNGWNWGFYLAQRGVSVCCLTSERNRKFIGPQLQQQPVAGLQIVYVPVPKWVDDLQRKNHYRFVYLHYYFWQKAAYQTAQPLHQAQPFDVVHHVTYGSIHMGSRLWKLGIPLVFGPVGGGQQPPLLLKKYFGGSWRKEQLRTFAGHLLLRLFKAGQTLRAASLVLTTNYETYALATRYGASSVRLSLDTALPASFYPDKVPERATHNQLKALWVGSMHPRKGVSFLLDVFANLPKHITLKLVGDGAQEAYIRQKIQQLGLADQVHCVGRVPYSEVKDFYRTHDAFVFCSLRDSYGSQLLEAMAYGLPVVALDHQGVRAFVPDTASYKVAISDPVTTVSNFQSALIELAERPKKRKPMSIAGYTYALENQWPHKVDSTIEDYNTLM